jgi:asparagine synthase (glutamine-hydrolysing)
VALCYFEGYIRNRRQLCRDLGLPEGTTEQAILDAGYRRWGAGLVHRLYGAFAIAFRDQADGSLFCARDQLGLQPFFYCLAGNGELLFSGDVNDIIGDPRYRPALDLQALQNYMSFGYPIGENTLWQGVHKLMPGQTLAFRAGKPVISTYYKPVYAPEHDRAEAYWTAQIEATLRAILSEDRENHDFRSACAFLSSGVDSSWLLALSGVRRAIGIGYPGEACSEAALAADTARALDADFCRVDISPEAFFDAIPVAVRRLGLPIADASTVALGIGCEVAARGSAVCLSGEGADEFFAGYHIYRRAEELARDGDPWHYGCAGVMEAEHAASLLKLERPFPGAHLVEPLYADSEGDEHLSRLLRIDCALWLEGDILFGISRSTRSCGLRLLLPYADRRLFELSVRIPAALKWKDGVGKYILRRAAEGQLPHEVAFRSKIGFSVPLGSWMRREPFRARVEAVLFGPQAALFFDQGRLRRYWSAFLEGNDVMRQIVYAAYVFLIWVREYNI